MSPFLSLIELLCKPVHHVIASSLHNLFLIAHSIMTSLGLNNINPTLAIDSQNDLLTQLNETYVSVDSKISFDHKLRQNCQQLATKTAFVIKFAKNYDYDSDHTANGYWTFARLVVKFGKLVLDSKVREMDLEKTLIPVSQILIIGLNLCHEFNENFENQLFSTDCEQFIDLLKVFKSLTPQLDVLYGNYCSFWLCPSMRRSMQGFTTLMALYSSGKSFSNLKTLWKRESRAHVVAHIAQNATVEFVKSFWGLTELSLVKNGIPNIVIKDQPKVVKNLFIPKQKQYFICEENEAKVLRKEYLGSKFSSNESIRCRFLSNNLPNQSTDSLVLHVHGGGFVSQSPDSHEIYLREWAVKLSGTPILSIDYSLSPESKYPKALQQILDSYLWLKSEDFSVEQMLGFQPKTVVVCGDSAGGNLSLALTLVLNEMRKSFPDDKHIPHPKAILCFYSPFMLLTTPSPSRLMTAVDTLLPLGVLLSCLEAYAPLTVSSGQREETKKKGFVGEAELEDQSFDFATLHFLNDDKEMMTNDDEMPEDNIDEDFVHITHDDVPPDEDIIIPLDSMDKRWQRKWRRAFLLIKDKLIGESAQSVFEMIPWYRTSDSELRQRLKDLNEKTKNPFISPLLYEHFHQLKETRLFLIALNFDACLDDSIQLAKKWPVGSVHLDIVDELPHGFLNFIPLSEEGSRASDLCVRRIREAFN